MPSSCVQIHWPATGVPGPTLQPSYDSTWAAMEALVDAKLVRSIGMSNLSAKKLEKLLGSCHIRPSVNQVEAHPYFRNDALLAFCQQQGVHVTAYSPLGSPDSAAIMGRAAGTPGPMQDPVVLRVAEKLGKSAAQARGGGRFVGGGQSRTASGKPGWGLRGKATLHNLIIEDCRVPTPLGQHQGAA